MDNKFFIFAVIFICLSPASAACTDWWNASYTTRVPIQSMGTTSNGYPIYTGTSLCGQQIWIDPTKCGADCWIYYNSCSDWTIGNCTARVPNDPSLNSYAGYLPTQVWPSTLYTLHHCGNGTTTATLLYDTVGHKNATDGNSWTINQAGINGNGGDACYSDGVADYATYGADLFDERYYYCFNLVTNPTNVGTGYQRFLDNDGTLGNYGEIMIHLRGDTRKWRFFIRADGGFVDINSDSIAANNTWQMVTMCKNTTGEFMWINGVLQSAFDTKTVSQNTATEWNVWARQAATENYRGYTELFQIFHHTATAMPTGTYWSELWSSLNGTMMTLGTPESSSRNYVSVIAPSGQTYLTNLTGAFYFNSSTWTSSSCQYKLDSGSFSSITGNATNATLKTFTFSTIEGAHTLNVTCETSEAAASALSSFTVVDYAVISDIYASTDYESNSSTFFLNINASDRITSITANLSWNGTILNTNGNAVGSLWSFNVSKIVPLLSANTSISTWWNFIVNYANSSYLGNTTTSHTINLNQSYLITAINNTPPVVLEGDQITLQSQISKTPVNNAAIDYVYFLVAGIPYLASLSSSTATYSIYYVSLYAPVATGGTTSYNATFHLTSNGTSLNKTSSTSSYTVSPIEFTNCSAGTNSTTKFITYNFYNEENLSQAVTSTLEISYYIVKNTVSKQFNFTSPVNTTYSNCFSPPNATILTNATMKYYATGYSTRYYYLSNALLTNASTTVPLYLLSNTSSTNFVFYLVDTNRNPVKGAILDIQRFYVSLNQFLAVAMGQTDYAAGATNINLLASENLYAITIIQGGVNTSFLYPISLTSTSITLTLSPQSFDQYSARSAYISSGCSNTTSTISCTYSDSSGLSPTVKLYVLRTFALTNITACSTNTTATAGTLICPLGNTTSTTYNYVLTADYSDGMHLVLQTGSLSYVAPPQFQGAQGLLLTAIIVIAGAFITINSPSVGVVLTLLALTTAKMLWLVNISSEAMAALYIIGLLLIYRLKW